MRLLVSRDHGEALANKGLEAGAGEGRLIELSEGLSVEGILKVLERQSVLQDVNI